MLQLESPISILVPPPQEYLNSFRKIFTYVKSTADGKNVIHTPIPYNYHKIIRNYNIQDKKILITLVNTYFTGYQYDLRIKSIRWFLENHPDDILFYGKGLLLRDLGNVRVYAVVPVEEALNVDLIACLKCGCGGVSIGIGTGQVDLNTEAVAIAVKADGDAGGGKMTEGKGGFASARDPCAVGQRTAVEGQALLCDIAKANSARCLCQRDVCPIDRNAEVAEQKEVFDIGDGTDGAG